MKINVANEERMLHDKYDDYSTNFILEVHGEDVGTIRHTAKRDGPSELLYLVSLCCMLFLAEDVDISIKARVHAGDRYVSL